MSRIESGEADAMAVKDLSFDTDARKALLAGVEKLSAAVKSTLGPRGRSAVIDKSWGGPTVTKDGVGVMEGYTAAYGGLSPDFRARFEQVCNRL